MKPIEALLLDLKSSDSHIRDMAALDLMDLKNEMAILPLFEAIATPENVNHRGTLVYALGAFDCLEHLEVLVDLVLTGNYEVSTGAFSIIEEFEVTAETIQRIEAQLHKYDVNNLPLEHSLEGYEALIQLVSDNRESV